MLYIILELQSRVDYTMPFRLLVYMTELLKRVFRDTPKKERERKEFRLPAVIPIVLYNGSQPWNAVQIFRDYLSDAGQFGQNILNFTYETLDLGRESDERILSTNTLLDNVFLLEKSESTEAARRILPRMIQRVSRLSPGDRQELMEWLHDVLLQLVPQSEMAEVLSLFQRGDEHDMESALVRVFREEQQRFRQEGLQEGRQKSSRDIARKLLNRKSFRSNDSAVGKGVLLPCRRRFLFGMVYMDDGNKRRLPMSSTLTTVL